jgi:hypothetical protein
MAISDNQNGQQVRARSLKGIFEIKSEKRLILDGVNEQVCEKEKRKALV